MALVKHPHWYQFLRYSEAGDDGTITTPFRELIKKMPGNTIMPDRLHQWCKQLLAQVVLKHDTDVAEVVLDRCIVSNPNFKDPGDINFTVIVNYEFLEDFATPKSM